MAKNIPTLKYTQMDYGPDFDFHMNAYTWALLKEALSVEDWEEIAYINAYTMDECPDFPGIEPFEYTEDFDVESEQFKMYKGTIWGTECAILKKQLNQDKTVGFVYIRIKDLGLCS